MMVKNGEIEISTFCKHLAVVGFTVGFVDDVNEPGKITSMDKRLNEDQVKEVMVSLSLIVEAVLKKNGGKQS